MCFYLLVIFEVLIFSFCSQATLYEGDSCFIKSMPGVCKKQNDCPELSKTFDDGFIKKTEIPRCGLEIQGELICCPSKNFVASLLVTRALQRPSETYCQKLELDWSKALIPHIYGGAPVYSGEYPHMVAIGIESGGKEKYNYICGGTLIAEKFVLTAAHCVTNSRQMPVVVLLGVVNLNDAQRYGEIIGIKNISVHDNFTARQFYDDIAVIELEREVKFTPFIYPTCLNTNNTLPLPDVELYVSGWGRTESGRYSNSLLKTKLHMISLDECNATYADFDVHHQFKSGIVDTQICALGEGKDACNGDSGGPLILVKNADHLQYSVVGVVSAGYRCGTTVPGLYTRVSSYLDFIENIVWPSFS